MGANDNTDSEDSLLNIHLLHVTRMVVDYINEEFSNMHLKNSKIDGNRCAIARLYGKRYPHCLIPHYSLFVTVDRGRRETVVPRN